MERLEVFKMIEGMTVSAASTKEGQLFLDFDPGGITLFVLPVIQIEDAYYHPESDDYRYKISSLVGRSVSGVFARGDDTTVIDLDGNCLIVMKDDNREPIEALVLEIPDQPIVVW